MRPLAAGFHISKKAGGSVREGGEPSLQDRGSRPSPTLGAWSIPRSYPNEPKETVLAFLEHALAWLAPFGVAAERDMTATVIAASSSAMPV